MTAAATKPDFVTFSPKLRADDPLANYWLKQVTTRLRREVWWCWHERGLQPGNWTALPAFSDRVSATLDMSRFWAEKQDFYVSEPTARYLTEQLLTTRPPKGNQSVRGSFGWIIETLQLEDVATFVLALGLATALDGSMGSIIACCHNDQTKPQPTIGLAQVLWDEPEQVLAVCDSFQTLFRYGLLKPGDSSGNSQSEFAWETPITVPVLIARQLLFPDSAPPAGLTVLEPTEPSDEARDAARLTALRLTSSEADSLRLVPMIGVRGSSRREIVRAVGAINHKPVLELQADPTTTPDRQYLSSIATVCWLKDAYLFCGKEALVSGGDGHTGARYLLPELTIPATVFLALTDRSQLSLFPTNALLPGIEVQPATYQQRIDCWKENLRLSGRERMQIIAECARRFRFEPETIRTVCGELNQVSGKITARDLTAACRAELDTNIGQLASRVVPRFADEELILPRKQHLMFQEVYRAMLSLTDVHYKWGTARVWNEGGISVLFAGAPGTGKTMAAEVLAERLDLPMYRIDLSQVVNKYIGETEKNLKRVFDAADLSDMILFFDEADSLFGRRTEVSDAHDRYANLEISYLLERMERFKGLAILATNRKKDLDEAFLRRLRYIIDFPLPDATERKRIWQQVIPSGADRSQVEFDFLAAQFPLSGGNIRSIVFNACLQSSEGASLQNGKGRRRLKMGEIIIAIKREYDKLNRTMSLQQYGPYASLVERLDSE